MKKNSGEIKPGDVVMHKPSGEEWIVAALHYSGDELAPVGWPACVVKVKDCVLVESCSVEESEKIVDEWSRMSCEDFRKTWNKWRKESTT
jgi:hypothetical protein